ncbi:hypothetical protein LguiA_015471 [Lonicera macranthoides]
MASSPPFQLEDQTDEDFFDKLVIDDDDYKVNAYSAPNLGNENDLDEVKAFANLSISEVDSGVEDSVHKGTKVKDEAIDKDVKAASVDAGIEKSTSLASVDSFVFDSLVESDNGVIGDEMAEGLTAVETVVPASNSMAIGTEVAAPVLMAIGAEVASVSTAIVNEMASVSTPMGTEVASSGSMEIGTEVALDPTAMWNEVASGPAPIGADVASGSLASEGSGSASSGVKEVQWSAFSNDAVQNGSNGFGSYSDFFGEFGDSAVEQPRIEGDTLNSESKVVSGGEEYKSAYLENDHNYMPYQEGNAYGASPEQSIVGQAQSTNGQDLNSSQYWEDLYPGWKYDQSTGQWYQVDCQDATANVQGSFESNAAVNWAAEDKSEVSYLQQTTQSVAAAIAESGTIESVTNWNQSSQEDNGYPSNMVFDPQYPGWYYDTIAQEWRSLDAYTSSAQSTDQSHQNGFASTVTSHKDDQKYSQVDNYATEGFNNQDEIYNWGGSPNNFSQQGLNTWQSDTSVPTMANSELGRNQQMENHYGQNFSVGNHVGVSSNNVNQQGLNTWQPDSSVPSVANSELGQNQQMENHSGQNFSVGNHVSQQNSYNYGVTTPSYEKENQGYNSQGFVPGGNFVQQFNQPRVEQNEKMNVSNDYYGYQNSSNYTQQPIQSGHQFSYAPAAAGRSSAGRPPHALVTFGFGGKLIVLKDNTSIKNSSYGSQDPVDGSISVLNLTEVVNGRSDAPKIGCEYFRALCQQSFPGPLTGGSVGVKELNKWIDERITHSESPDMDYRQSEVLRLLLSLLKIACQHYGKLRSPFGTDSTLKESDVPEAAVARLFASVKRNSGAQFSEYGALAHCLQKLPPEGQMLATAVEVQTLLVSGRKKDALHCAQQGQLWGPALVLAAQLGDQFYVDTVKQMALRQLVAGTPLRTLCLLIAGQPADVFSTETTADTGIYSAGNIPQRPAQLGANGMLDDWEENLAVITANRTKDDELVLIHLGDCLWKERSEIIAAHICYLVAEANIEPYSDSARLCLVGADHWKFPRTYASPEAIQRTEIYEYSKVLGNSQFMLLPFQPYKLLYANMLAEVGRVSDSLKYCQAVSKTLKTGRAPEVETWRQLVSSLEERIRTHQQGGFSTNLAPAKLVGKLLTLFDSTAHRVVGGLPPPVPSASLGSVQVNEHYNQSMGPRVSTSQSTMAMTSLMPSASTEPISEWTADGNRMTMQNRSASEPNFGRTPRQDQVDSSKETTSSNSTQGKASVSPSTSRFGRFSFGSQLLQKTVGLVLKPRQDKQAKLGDTNKFYYDEKLKRWVEEGVDPPAEEAALPPPPTNATFPNGTSDYNLKNALKSEGSLSNGSPPEYKSPTPPPGHGSGMPPIPPTSNQFSARGRMGVRSRYVDTFNQGGGNPANLFQTPAVPTIKPATTANPKFFVPTPSSLVEQPVDPLAAQSAAITENPSIPSMNNSYQSPSPPPPMTMQRFASMDNITNGGSTTRTNSNGSGSLSSNSRRTASWSGSLGDAFSSPPNSAEVKPLSEALSIHPSSFVPSGGPALPHSSMNGGSYGDDLHEVEL